MTGEQFKIYQFNQGDQLYTIFNAIPGGASLTSPAMIVDNGVKIGSIEIVTPSAYNGTTGTAVLQGTNDGVNWAGVLQDDNVTAMSFTLATNSTYTWYLKAVLFKYYRIVFTHGDASAGTVSATFVGKK